MNLVAPKLIDLPLHISGNDWLLRIYEDQADLYKEENFLQELKSICESYEDETIILSHQYFGFPFLLKIDGERKRVLFAHLRLNKELFLNSLLEDSSDNIQEFQEHLREFTNFDFSQNTSVLEKKTRDYNLVDFFSNEEKFNKVDEKAEKLVLEIDKKMDSISKNLFEKSSDIFLSLISQYESLRNYTLKFIASLPSLEFKNNHGEVKRLFLEAIRRIKANQEYQTYPWHLRALISFIGFDAKVTPALLLSKSIHFMVELMAKRFIAGVDIKDAKNSLLELKKSGRDSSLDPLGELVVSQKEANEYFEKVIDFIKGFKEVYSPGERNKAGILKAHISIKVSALTHHFSSEDIDFTYSHIAPKLKDIFQEAKKHKVFINIDAEHFHIRDSVVDIVFRVLENNWNELEGVEIGFVLQAYLRDAFEHLNLIENRNELSLLLPIRLVKGAYWDQETIEADAHHYNAPQFLNKVETDLHYKQLIHHLFSKKGFQLVLASHNLYDHAWAIALKRELFPNAKEIEHQCLHMTYEALSKALNQLGNCVRNYIPIGNLLVGMAYLVRRIMENSSQVGVLSQMRSDIDVKEILNQTEQFKKLKSSNSWTWDKNTSDYTADFLNIPPVRTYLEGYRNDFGSVFKIYKDHDLNVNFDTESSAREKFDGLEKSDWNKTSSQKLRIITLMKAAEAMTKRRYYFASLVVVEAKKSINEALADVDEAIDFISFYIREEARRDSVEARKSLIIAPWNFPLAILCGMSVGSLVRGHMVAMKPAEQTPYIGLELYKLFIEAGVPKKSLVLIQGDGREVASGLIGSGEVDLVTFTGSRQVGTLIYQNLILKSENELKRVIAEMGGKNSIIVSKNSDLDEVLKGALYSCFAHAGQKCSACSILMIEKQVYTKFRDRFEKASEDIEIGMASSYATQINPLVTPKEKSRVLELRKKVYEAVKKWKGKVLVDRVEAEGDSLVGPLVYEISAQAYREESLFRQEYFAPVIALIKIDDLDEGIELNNGSDYALTCGVFSQSDDDIDYLLKSLENGNIYINRSCTGARVGIEPFGGFKFSGTGPKAGGGNYLDGFDFDNFQLESYQAMKIPGQNSYIDEELDFSKKIFILKDEKEADESLDRSLVYTSESFKKENISKFEDIEVIYIQSMDVFHEVKSSELLVYKKGLRKILFMSQGNKSLSKERLMAINTMRYGAPIAEE